MRKSNAILIIIFFLGSTVYSQTTGIQGKPITEIFADFHKSINDTSETSGFGLNRAYFGYNFLPQGNFSGTLIVNIGSPDELAAGSVHRRYAHFREASLSWSKDKIIITFGITGTRVYDYQLRFWGKRYIANTFQTLNGYGFIADLGVVVDYKFNDILKGDIAVMNGEGYSDLQLDNSVKTSAGLTFTPSKRLSFRLYSDITNPRGIWQATLIGFAGYKNDLFSIGVESSYKSNLDLIGGHNSWGFSGTGGINILKQTELFVRYDHSNSGIMPGDLLSWNYNKQGTFVIAGVQYTFTPNVKMALNYQGTYPDNKANHSSDLILLNATFKF